MFLYIYHLILCNLNTITILMENKIDTRKFYEKIETRHLFEGIDAEFVVPEYKFIIEEFICTICSNLVFDPTNCENCDNCFCKICITKWLKNNKICPNMCKEFKQSKIRRVPQNILNKIRLFCTYKNQGCVEVINYENYRSHIENCDYILCKCLSPGCEFKDIKKNIMLHLLACPLLYDTCMYCRKGFKKSTLDYHYANCPERKDECPNCKKEFYLKDIGSHKKRCVKYTCQFCKDNLSKEEFESHNACSELIRNNYEGKILTLLNRISDLENTVSLLSDENDNLKKVTISAGKTKKEELNKEIKEKLNEKNSEHSIDLSSSTNTMCNLNQLLNLDEKPKKKAVKKKNHQNSKKKAIYEVGEKEINNSFEKHYENINSNNIPNFSHQNDYLRVVNMNIAAITTVNKKKYHSKTIFSIIHLNKYLADPNLIAVASYDRKISLWDLQNKIFKGYLENHYASVTCLLYVPTYNPDIFLSSGGDEMIFSWDIKNKQVIHTFTGHKGWIEKMIYLEEFNANWFASCSWDYTIIVWDLSTSSKVCTFEGHLGTVTSLLSMTLSDTTYIISASNSSYDSGNIFIWNLKTQSIEKKLSLPNHTSIQAIEVIKDSSYLLCCSEEAATLCDVVSGSVINKFIINSYKITCLSYIKNEDQIFPITLSAYPESKIRLWDLAENVINSISNTHKKSIKMLLNISQISNFNGIFISGGDDGVLNIFNIFTSELIKSINALDKCVTALQVFDNFLVVGSNDGALEIFKLTI